MCMNSTPINCKITIADDKIINTKHIRQFNIFRAYPIPIRAVSRFNQHYIKNGARAIIIKIAIILIRFKFQVTPSL